MTENRTKLGPIPDEWYENEAVPSTAFEKMAPKGWMEALEAKIKNRMKTASAEDATGSKPQTLAPPRPFER